MIKYKEKYGIYQIEEITNKVLMRLVNSCKPSKSRCSGKYKRHNEYLTSTVIKKNKHNSPFTYVNVYSGFDIETTKESETLAFMYVWMVSVGNNVIMGDTWEQFETLIDMFKYSCDLSNTRRLLIYTHNLSYEFGFCKKVFKNCKITSSFLKSTHNPLSLVIDECVEIRDSLALTNMPLSKLTSAYDLTINKLVGDLDYSTLRYSRDDLKESEKPYCYNDVLILSEFSEKYVFGQLMANIKYRKNLPLTSTAILRNRIYDEFVELIMRDCGVSHTFIKQHLHEFLGHVVMPNTYEDYLYLMNYVYCGGVSKVMAKYNGVVIDESYHMKSYDITSSYPFELFTKYFPVRQIKRKITSIDDILSLPDNIVCVVELAFKGLKCSNGFSFIPRSKMLYEHNLVDDNRKVHYAQECVFACTNIDLKTIVRAYDWEDLYISMYECFECEYLPLYMLKPLYTAYILKQALKEQELNYTTEKAVVNSGYGLTCQRLPVDTIEYTTDGGTHHSKQDENYNIDAIYEKYKETALYSPYVGVFVSAYARYHLINTVCDLIEMGHDVVYTDTDSIKVLYADSDVDQYFKKHNESIAKQVKAFCDRQNISDDDGLKYFYGKNGLGQYELEWSKMLRFKSLGSKRYIMDVVKDDKVVKIDTIAGLPKNELTRWCDLNNLNRYEQFEMNLHIPSCGKLTHHYVDEPQINSKGVVVPSCIVLSDCDFTLDIEQGYLDFLSSFIDENESLERRLL